MAALTDQIDSFHRFAHEQAENGGSEMTIDELFDQWRVENPTNDECAENAAAINASVLDFNRGERGTPAGEHSVELRREFQLAQ
jgi:hypothetical protein